MAILKFKKKKNSGKTNRGYSGGHPAVITAALGVEALFSMRCTHDKIEAAHENNDSKRADHTYIASRVFEKFRISKFDV